MGQSPSVDSQCPGCHWQAVVTLRLPCAIVESPWHHKYVLFVNITFLLSRLIKRLQWSNKWGYHGKVFAHLATGCGNNAKDPSGLDSDRWIPHSVLPESTHWFLRHLSAGFNDLKPAPWGLSLDEHFLWNFSHVNATEQLWWQANIGSSNGLVSSGTNPLSGPMLTHTSPYGITRPRKVNDESLFVEIMALHWRGNRPLSKPYICILATFSHFYTDTQPRGLATSHYLTIYVLGACYQWQCWSVTHNLSGWSGFIRCTLMS